MENLRWGFPVVFYGFSEKGGDFEDYFESLPEDTQLRVIRTARKTGKSLRDCTALLKRLE